MNQKLHTFAGKTIPIRKIVRDRFVLNFRQTYLLCIFLVIVLWVYYVWILNANANRGYEARRLELERKAVQVEQNSLRVTIAQQESLEELFSHIDGVVEIDEDEVTYVTLAE